MTPAQISQVQGSFAHVVPIADQAADLFYDRLFGLDPSLRPLFKGRPARAEAGAGRDAGHRRERPGQVGHDRAGHGAARTASRRLRRAGAHYPTVGSALLWTLEQGLGDRFQPQTREAWTVAFTLLADTMKAAARN